jgi:peptide/nickel transport system permease protein
MKLVGRALPTLYLRIAAGVLLFMLAVALLGNLIAPHDPLAQSTNSFAGSSWSHPLGTDFLGRDTLSRLITGAAPSLLSAVVAVAIGLVGGAIPGMASVFLTRRVEWVVMRVVDALMTIPPIIFAIAIVAGFGNGLDQAVIAIGVLLVPRFFRVVRAETLKLASAQYVEAATLFGASRTYVLRRHVWRKIVPTLAVISASALGYSVLGISGLAFLGLGELAPAASWGGMLSNDLTYLYQDQWAAIWPGLAISLTVWALNALSDAAHTTRSLEVETAAAVEPVLLEDEQTPEPVGVPQYV